MRGPVMDLATILAALGRRPWPTLSRRRGCGSALPTPPCRWARHSRWLARSAAAMSGVAGRGPLLGRRRTTARCSSGSPRQCAPKQTNGEHERRQSLAPLREETTSGRARSSGRRADVRTRPKQRSLNPVRSARSRCPARRPAASLAGCWTMASLGAPSLALRLCLDLALLQRHRTSPSRTQRPARRYSGFRYSWHQNSQAPACVPGSAPGLGDIRLRWPSPPSSGASTPWQD